MKNKPNKILNSESLDLTKFSDEEVFFLKTQVEKECARRNLKFDVGDVGELISINFFNNKPGLEKLQKAPTGTKNVDALSRKGDRYSIKTIKKGSKTGTIYPDPEDENKQLFEYLLIVILDDDFGLKSIHRFSWKVFGEVRMWDKTMRAWYVPKTNKALNQGEVIHE